MPSWVKDPRKLPLMINARSETVREKAAFKNALRRRRCLLPANGYYEWREFNGRKRPLFIQARDGSPIAFAGLAETWAGPNGEEMDSVAIVTAAASPEMAALHNRVPVTIGRDQFESWLDCAAFDADAAMALLVAPVSGSFVWHEVSMAVNQVANDGPELMLPISAEQAAAEGAKQQSVRARRAKFNSDQGLLL